MPRITKDKACTLRKGERTDPNTNTGENDTTTTPSVLWLEFGPVTDTIDGQKEQVTMLCAGVTQVDGQIAIFIPAIFKS